MLICYESVVSNGSVWIGLWICLFPLLGENDNDNGQSKMDTQTIEGKWGEKKTRFVNILY